MKQLIYASTKGIVKGFDPQLYKTLKADVPENIYYLLKNLQVSYGLSLPDFLYEQLTIFLKHQIKNTKKVIELKLIYVKP